jgi:hypothetical protein
MLVDVLGSFHNNASGVKRGEIVELPEEVADRYRHLGYCEDLDAAEQTDRQRKERADLAQQAFEAYGKRRLANIERSRVAQHTTIDCRTGQPINSK